MTRSHWNPLQFLLFFSVGVFLFRWLMGRSIGLPEPTNPPPALGHTIPLSIKNSWNSKWRKYFESNFNWLEALNYFLSKSVTTFNFIQTSRFRFQFFRNYLQFIGVSIMIRVSANHHWAKMTSAILAVIRHFGETNCGLVYC